jgi:hypothetical protein
MSIYDSGMTVVDLTNDGEARPSGAVKDEPVVGLQRRHVQLPPLLRPL